VSGTPSSQTRAVVQGLLIIAGVALGVWALYRLAAVVLLVIFAGLFAYVMAPLVTLAEHPVRIASRRRTLPRGAAIVLLYALMAGSIAIGGMLLLPSVTEQMDDMIASAPAYAQSIAVWERGWSRYYDRLRIPLELRRSIDESVLAAGDAAVQSSRASALALVGALSNLPWLVLIPVLGFFLLKDAASFRRSLLASLPERVRLRGDRLLDDLNATLGAYVRAQLLACAVAGTVCGIGFAVIGVPYPVLLGVLACVLEFIPLVGPLLLAIVASIVGALHAPILALWTVAFLGVFRIIEDYVIYPRLIRRGIPLHPLTVILAVLAGAELDGVAGMFLAVPVVGILSVVYRHAVEWRGGDANAPTHGAADLLVTSQAADV
jgi:predicted PurR-regulated permease PerM